MYMLYKEKILAGQNGFSNFHNTQKEACAETRPLLLNKWGTAELLRGILLLIFKCLQQMIKVNFFSIHNAHGMMYCIHLNTYFNYNYLHMYQLSTGFTIQTIDACFDTCRNAPYMYMTQVSFTFTHSLIVTQTVRVCILHVI